MKIDLKNMDTYRFVIFVLIFVLIFTLIFTAQMKSVVSFQNRILEQYLEKPKTTSTYQSTPATTTNKYQNY